MQSTATDNDDDDTKWKPSDQQKTVRRRNRFIASLHTETENHRTHETDDFQRDRPFLYNSIRGR